MELQLYKNVKLYTGDISRIEGVGCCNYSAGDSVDTLGAHWFELDCTSYSKLSGFIAYRSNQESLELILKENGVLYTFKRWAFGGVSLLIDINALGSRLIDDIITGLENYPLIDESHFNQLEHNLINEYLKELAESEFNNFKGDNLDSFTSDFIRVYWDLWGNLEGVIFEEGLRPYLDRDYIDAILSELNSAYVNKGGLK